MKLAIFYSESDNQFIVTIITTFLYLLLLLFYYYHFYYYFVIIIIIRRKFLFEIILNAFLKMESLSCLSVFPKFDSSKVIFLQRIPTGPNLRIFFICSKLQFCWLEILKLFESNMLIFKGVKIKCQ